MSTTSESRVPIYISSYFKLYPNDPLWDGQQCNGNEGPCCTNPKMPWFIRHSIIVKLNLNFYTLSSLDMLWFIETKIIFQIDLIKPLLYTDQVTPYIITS